MAIVASSLSRCFLNKRYGEDAGSASETQCDNGGPVLERTLLAIVLGGIYPHRDFC